MGKFEDVQQFKNDYAGACDQVFMDLASALYDKAQKAKADELAGQVQAPSGFSQEQVDQMVSDAKSLDAQDKQAALDAMNADMQSKMADLQSQIDALGSAKSDSDSKLAVDESVIQGLKGSMAQLQGVMDVLKGLFAPPAPPVEEAPQPSMPMPEQPAVDPAQA